MFCAETLSHEFQSLQRLFTATCPTIPLCNPTTDRCGLMSHLNQHWTLTHQTCTADLSLLSRSMIPDPGTGSSNWPTKQWTRTQASNTNCNNCKRCGAPVTPSVILEQHRVVLEAHNLMRQEAAQKTRHYFTGRHAWSPEWQLKKDKILLWQLCLKRFDREKKPQPRFLRRMM